jgi:hypothetical protein
VEGLTAIGISTGNKGGLVVASGTAIGLVAAGMLADGTTQDLTNSVLWTSSDAAANMSDALGSCMDGAGLENYTSLTPRAKNKRPFFTGLPREQFWSGFLTPLP